MKRMFESALICRASRIVACALFGAVSVAQSQDTWPSPTSAWSAGGGAPSDVVLRAAPLRADSRSAQVRQITRDGLAAHLVGDVARARRQFEAAQRLDPTCVLCVWGEALALGASFLGSARQGDSTAAARATLRAASMLAARTAHSALQPFVDALVVLHYGPPHTGAARASAYAMQLARLANESPGNATLQLLAADAMFVASRADVEGGGAPDSRLQTLALDRVVAALVLPEARVVGCGLARRVVPSAARWQRRHCLV
jgi:hypothetical protein